MGAGLVARVDLLELRTLVTGPGHRMTAAVVALRVAATLAVALQRLLHDVLPPGLLRHGALDVAGVVVPALHVALDDGLRLVALLLDDGPGLRALLGARRVGAALRLAGPHAAHGLEPTMLAFAVLFAFGAEGLCGIGVERGAAAHEDGLLTCSGVLEGVLAGDGARQEVVDPLWEAEPREGQEPQARQERDQPVPEVHGSQRTNGLRRKRCWQAARCRCC
mmetsp:Transcript_60596/g.163194  ORF Transcript_60596/g.163194 Transcript_60596/m.163194 type:complete len:221 (+) Transcript_60596:193-855(+)